MTRQQTRLWAAATALVLLPPLAVASAASAGAAPVPPETETPTETDSDSEADSAPGPELDSGDVRALEPATEPDTPTLPDDFSLDVEDGVAVLV